MELTVIDADNEAHRIAYRHFEYANLLDLIINNFYSEIGECKGKGLCGTCIVEIINGELQSERCPDETFTLNVNGMTHPKYRLACQLPLDKKLNNLTFKEIG
ncbi:MAG: ferredoxin [Pseudooceanicola sp.]|nr:ferredoxin [Pseudooceanicola sp.]|tara:strand:+ start:402 stop:707 length:306 start_codon:yes stop_codon:yes gene_type:complete